MIPNFKKGYINLADEMVLPSSPEQLDVGEDEKMSLWRVVIMSHKKADFINEMRIKFKSWVKEYDEEEILRLPEETKEKKKLELSIQDKEEKLVKYYEAWYSEVYHAILHLKVSIYSNNIYFYLLTITNSS